MESPSRICSYIMDFELDSKLKEIYFPDLLKMQPKISIISTFYHLGI